MIESKIYKENMMI